jgi:hypothetical protein
LGYFSSKAAIASTLHRRFFRRYHAVEGGGAILAGVDALSDQMQQIGRELRLVAVSAGVGVSISGIAVVGICERCQRIFEGCLGLLEDLGRLDRYAPALALALRGKIGRAGDAVTLRDHAGVLVGAGAFAHALANCLALGGVDGACETEPEVRIARRGLDDDRGLRCRRPCPALVAVAVDDERKDPERIF